MLTVFRRLREVMTSANPLIVVAGKVAGPSPAGHAAKQRVDEPLNGSSG